MQCESKKIIQTTENQVIVEEKDLFAQSDGKVLRSAKKTFNTQKEKSPKKFSRERRFSACAKDLKSRKSPSKILDSGMIKSSSLNSSKKISSSSTSENDLLKNYTLEFVWERLSLLASIFKKIEEKQAITIDSEHNFCVIDLKQTSTSERQSCVKEILDSIQLVAHHILNITGSVDKIIYLAKVLTYLEQARWCKSFFVRYSKINLALDLELTKKSIEEGELIVKEFPSTKLVSELFAGELDDAEPLDKITLDDLSLTYTKFIKPSDLFARVLKVLTNNSESKTDLLEFCKKCLKNEIGLKYFPSPEIELIIEKINNEELKDLYQQISAIAETKKQATETVKIKPLNEEELKQIAEWHKSIEAGNQETAEFVTHSIVKKTMLEFSKILLDELLSNNLLSPELCPKYNQLTTFLNCLIDIVVKDILLSQSKKEKANVITFYVRVIEKCIDRGNYTSSFAIRLALEQINLKEINDALSKDTLNQIKIFYDLFELSGCSKNLRSQMKNCNSDYYMPALFLIGRDLNGIEEMQTDEGLINQYKFRFLSRKVLGPFQTVQKNLAGAKILETKDLFDRKFEAL